MIVHSVPVLVLTIAESAARALAEKAVKYIKLNCGHHYAYCLVFGSEARDHARICGGGQDELG